MKARRNQCLLAKSRQKTVASIINIEPLRADESEWEKFLSRSVNGTLFHDLRFLRYHPAGRFRFHHLVFKRNGKPVALLPGGISGTTDRPIFCSPLGASFGGPALMAGLGAEVALDFINALQNYAREQCWGGIEITLPPPCYSFETSGLIEFALFYWSFRVVHRWLCPVLSLAPGSENNYERMFRNRQIRYVRAAKRKGMIAIESGIHVLNDFLRVFHDTYARHGVEATHTPEEIRDLLQRFPDQVRIHLAMLGEIPIAGLLVFRLTASVAYTFYICSNSKYAHEHGAAFVIAKLIDRLSNAGFRYIDFGPSASDQKFNKGVSFFKEGLGAAGQCRDRWFWETK
jgi:Acetyltransferase (GNAT) domain